jgi:superkiller protein 3
LKNALETARKAIALDPSDPLAHVMLGIVLTRSADYEEAIAAYEHAINLNPSDANAYVSMGMALALAGSPEEGIAAFEKGFQLSPQEPHNHLYFAYMARAQLTGHLSLPKI